MSPRENCGFEGVLKQLKTTFNIERRVENASGVPRWGKLEFVVPDGVEGAPNAGVGSINTLNFVIGIRRFSCMSR